jgi:catechol 2,3-dioxygenase-like lactoylglutathione lyase family enzyme
MAITGIKSLRYGVEDVGTSARFFADFGLPLVTTDNDRALFRLDDGSTVEVLPLGHPSFPSGKVEGPGVQELVWGVDTPVEVASLVGSLSKEYPVTGDEFGVFHFISDFGFPMGISHWDKKRVVNAPDPLNAPDHVMRLNTHRKWRRRARPKVINHVVFKVPDFRRAARFLYEKLGFRVSDIQGELGFYLRADGSNNHHNFAVLNANAPLPGCDGKLRFDHANFGVEDIDELMIGANYMTRRKWAESRIGLGRHRIDSALFYYLPCPAGGEAEYGADSDYLDDNWVPRWFTVPLFAYAHFTHNIPPFLLESPEWEFSYLKDEQVRAHIFNSGTTSDG